MPLTHYVKLDTKIGLRYIMLEPSENTVLSKKVPDTHSQIEHYFFSYLLTCKLDIFEVLDIMAQMWHYINFFSYKPTKGTSYFILNYLKKVIGGTTT